MQENYSNNLENQVPNPNQSQGVDTNQANSKTSNSLLGQTPPAQEVVEPKTEKLFLGKYKSEEDAQKGYQSAEAKIRDQGAELNKMKEQYKPMEDYSEESWNAKFEFWKSEKSLPENVSYDPSVPEINMLIKGFEKAGVSENQAKAILAGAAERQIAMLEEKRESIVKELGPEGMKKVQDLSVFGSTLSGEDAAIFESFFTFPYVEANQVDLMHRLLYRSREKNIPTGATSASSHRSPTDIRNAIHEFETKNKDRLSYDEKTQEELRNMWGQLAQAKSRVN
jgi:hypothetical protein